MVDISSADFKNKKYSHFSFYMYKYITLLKKAKKSITI